MGDLAGRGEGGSPWTRLFLLWRAAGQQRLAGTQAAILEE